MPDIKPRITFYYAEIDWETNMCIGVSAQSYTTSRPDYVEIPVYDEEYIFKFYINGNWYEDAEGTIPWSSSLL